MKMRSWYLLGFLFAAAILASVSGLVVRAEVRLGKDADWVQHSHEVLASHDEIRAMNQAALAAQRGYLLTGSKAYESRYWRAREQVLLEGESLQRLVDDNPEEAARVQRLFQALTSRLDLAKRGMEIHDTSGVGAAAAFVAGNGGAEMDERIIQLGAEIRQAETQLLAERKLSVARSTGTLFLSALLGIPFSLLILGILYGLLIREQSVRERAEAGALAANTELRRSVGQLETLSARLGQLTAYTGMLQSCLDAEEVLEVTRQALPRLMPLTAGTVYLIRASKDHAEARMVWGEHRVPSQAMPDPGACWAMRRNQPHFVEDLQEAVGCAHLEGPVAGAATACLPLSAQGESLGWLYLSAAQGELPEPELMLSATEQLSLALVNLRLKDKLRQQSIRDPLTGLFNRRYLEESAEREVARCLRRKLPLCVLIFDLDHFKAFNDTHGHPGGDALLSAFGQMLKTHCRQEDIPCRFGGEEFVLILPEMGLADGLTRAEGIRAATQELAVRHQGKALGPVTVSIGIACCPDHGTLSGDLIHRADEALYRAKAQGRDRVETAIPPI
ncbi:MAG TPA: diguanylate cyclase [Holophagaceae bacterium]|nr:diguanylate cyclase [Holophagaceae bacterium]